MGTGLAGLIVLLLYLQNIRAALVLIAAFLFVSTLGLLSYTGSYTPNDTWLQPVQASRTLIAGVIGGLLLVGVITHSGRVSLRQASGQGMFMIAIPLYAGLLRMHF